MLNIRIVTVSGVMALTLVLGAAPVLAASSRYNQGVLASKQNSVVGASASCQTPHALGLEGGVLSLLFARDRPTAVADMIKSGMYTFRTIHAEDATYVAYIPRRCL